MGTGPKLGAEGALRAGAKAGAGGRQRWQWRSMHTVTVLARAVLAVALLTMAMAILTIAILTYGDTYYGDAYNGDT